MKRKSAPKLPCTSQKLHNREIDIFQWNIFILINNMAQERKSVLFMTVIVKRMSL